MVSCIMPYAAKIVLHAPVLDSSRLSSFVETCLMEGVVLIAIVGPGADKLEDLIDDLIAGDGSDPDRFIATTSHPGESVQDVLNFAHFWITDTEADVQEIRF